MMNKKICEMVADRVLEELKNGVVPWNKPWFGTDSFVSHVNGKQYSLLNCILLGKPGEYATFNQIKKEGGKVKKGAKHKIVVFWKINKKTELNDDGELVETTYPMLQYYKVFNLDDCEGVRKKYLTDEKRFSHDVVSEAEDIVSGYTGRNETLKIERDKESNRAFYRPSEDKIVVPVMGQFEKVEEFYSTLFHEMIHSTGHWSRLNRFGEDNVVAAFGDDYGKEELVAELGAAALCGKCGIETKGSFRNSVAYLNGWVEAIKGNPEMIVAAAGKADKAVDFVLNGKGEECA